jgi:hypothetical protein
MANSKAIFYDFFFQIYLRLKTFIFRTVHSYKVIFYRRISMTFTKKIVTLGMICLGGYLASSGYHYIFNDTYPEVVITGLDNNQYCSGDVPLTITGKDSGGIGICR